ncbi:nitrate- and nitrite sensing domain-containing protein [Streptomyces sp. NBC_00102]|uniref:sensor histidine kinase n=1 Tax=Streptomyces sp. NBC_00102 TaxID=2975652 RepID=UPI00224CAF8E|nr:nitrate- and nitrite sensing domain-containing protein [Streptomyces sp. NBC_00102]MCX5395765.1 nitrate- and nitrite sensing domain-containing protein [Streptomyces sp. NBC_00102]
MRFRGKSIRRKIAALLLVPLVSLTALWAFATYVTGRQASQMMDAGSIVEKVGHPLEQAVRSLQDERRQTLVFLADPRASDALPLLHRQQAVTDRTVAEIRSGAARDDIRDELSTDAQGRLDAVLSAADGLPALRRSVENRGITRLRAMDFYDRLVDPAYRFLNSLRTMEHVSLDKQVRALVGVSRARELLSREDALVASGLLTSRLTDADLRQVAALVAQRQLLYQINLDMLPSDERLRVERFWASPETEPLRTAENGLIAGGEARDRAGIDSARWQQAAPPVLDRLANDYTEMTNRFQDRAEPAGYRVLALAGVSGVLGFLALLVSVFVSVRIGRELVRDLSRLRKEAHEASGVRLPGVMRRLAAGERIDVETEAPHLSYEPDEIGQVGQALNTLQRAAVEAAVRQADMRRGVSEVFVNLARRNQVLLHRQLTLLDAMERRTESDEELADLFRLDHLTTRMRRHAEGLVILSGAAPSRQWRKPVQLMDVVRAAVAEVEDYERIEVRRLPRIGVGGPAVADLTHLIAELLENATAFSPPHTGVQVHGDRVTNGFTLEIHDRGLGMTPEILLDANLRLAETPDFELSDTDRLGLFVVSRLAQRQKVRVSLQKSPYGGTTAVVFIPANLLTEAPETHGTGFRLDRRSERALPGPRSERTPPATPSPLPPAPGSPIDGPVELEAPMGPRERAAFERARDRALDPALAPVLGGLGDLEDSDSERGGLFRPREQRRSDGPEQHQQAGDEHEGPPPPVHPMRFDGPAPLPRRTPPTLVAEHGRRIGAPRSGGPTRSVPRTDDAAGAPLPPRAPVPPRTPAAVPPQPDAEPVTVRVHDTVGGLPRRIRQASLVPQLREEAEGGGGQEAPAAEGDDIQREAEQVRDRMASLQRGWQRGRRQNAGEPTDTGGSEAGTPPGGDGR